MNAFKRAQRSRVIAVKRLARSPESERLRVRIPSGMKVATVTLAVISALEVERIGGFGLVIAQRKKATNVREEEGR